MTRIKRINGLGTALAVFSTLIMILAVNPGPVLAEHPNAFGRPTADNPQPGKNITATRATRPTGWIDQTRSEVLARNGIVATSNPLAVEAGLEILRKGGNAVDAAVAAAATLALVEANSTGIGADMFAQVWSARDKKLYGINANGWSPEGYTAEWLQSMGCYPNMPTNSICSAMIPGAIDGFDKLLKRFGNFTFKEVLEPVARLAEEGFGVHEVFNNSLMHSAPPYSTRLSWDPDTAAIYLDENGDVPALYSIFKNPDMAHTFRILQKKGVDAFYRGEIAEAMVAKANYMGGVWTLEDLSEYEAYWTEPLSINYKGYDFSQLPPPGQGWAALEMLNIIEACVPYHGYDLAELGRPNPLFTHFLVEAKKLAYSDLHRYNADPAFYPPPLETLLSKEYAASLCDLIDPAYARSADVQGNIDGGTIYLATADRWGNMVSLVYSTYSAFGGGITIPGYGFQFSSRGRGFTLGEPDHPNRPEGRKRPFITIIAGFIMKDGEPLMAIGNMGGGTQPQAHAQHMVNLIDLGFNVQATTDAARFDHSQFSDVLRLDHYLYEAVGAELADMGHTVQESFGLGGGYQGIFFERDWSLPEPVVPGGRGSHGVAHQEPVNGIYRAGSDLRKDGMAAGW